MHDIFLNRRIKQFLAVYECGTIHGAAEALGVSQPALTVSLRNLELDLGIKLFVRSVRGMAPTPAGDTLHRFGATLRQGGRLALEEIRMQSEDHAGGLRIGAGVAWATTILPSVLDRLQHKFPGVSLDLITGVGDQLATRLISAELDVIIAAGSVQSLANTEFRCQALTNLSMKVVADPRSKIASYGTVTPAQLSAVPWVGFYEDESMVQFSNHFLALHGQPPAQFSMRTNSPKSLISYLCNTEYVAVLIAPLAEAAVSSGLVELETTTPLWDLPVSIYYRAIASYSPTVRAFSEFTEHEMKRFGTVKTNLT